LFRAAVVTVCLKLTSTKIRREKTRNNASTARTRVAIWGHPTRALGVLLKGSFFVLNHLQPSAQTLVRVCPEGGRAHFRMVDDLQSQIAHGGAWRRRAARSAAL